MLLAILVFGLTTDQVTVNELVYLCASETGRQDRLSREEGIVAGSDRLVRTNAGLACRPSAVPLACQPFATFCLVGLSGLVRCRCQVKAWVVFDLLVTPSIKCVLLVLACNPT